MKLNVKYPLALLSILISLATYAEMKSVRAINVEDMPLKLQAGLKLEIKFTENVYADKGEEVSLGMCQLSSYTNTMLSGQAKYPLYPKLNYRTRKEIFNDSHPIYSYVGKTFYEPIPPGKKTVSVNECDFIGLNVNPPTQKLSSGLCGNIKINHTTEISCPDLIGHAVTTHDLAEELGGDAFLYIRYDAQKYTIKDGVFYSISGE